MLAHLLEDAGIATCNVYHAWDDVVRTINTPEWHPPALLVEIEEGHRTEARCQGMPLLDRPYYFTIQLFGRYEGPGASEERDDLLSAIMRRLDPVAGNIAVVDQTVPEDERQTLGYLRILGFSGRPLNGEGRVPEERYRASVDVRCRYHQHNVAT